MVEKQRIRHAAATLAGGVWAICIGAIVCAGPLPAHERSIDANPQQAGNTQTAGIGQDTPNTALHLNGVVTESKPCMVQLPAMWKTPGNAKRAVAKADMAKQRKQVKMGENCKQ